MEELPCYCINLDERPERWEETRDAFKETGITPQRFPATRHTVGWKGCGASHVAVIREAQRRGYPWVLIIEDDCAPSDTIAEKWPALCQELWETREHWDVFLGGPTHIQAPAEHLTSNLLMIDHAYALHFYVICRENYDRALKWDPEEHGQIDVYYADIFRIATVTPIIAVQRPSLSNIIGRDADYTELFTNSELALKKLSYMDRTRVGTVMLLFASLLIVGIIWKKRQ
jgi:hypothetical protein